MAEHNGLDGRLMTVGEAVERFVPCLLYTSPSPRD